VGVKVLKHSMTEGFVNMRQPREDGGQYGRPVEIRIEELVLHGFAPGDRHRIARAVQRELARRFRQGGVPESASDSSALASIEAGAIHIPQGVAPWTAGTRIGAAIYRGLHRQSRLEQAARHIQPAPGGQPR
jgi:hypothetical protein